MLINSFTFTSKLSNPDFRFTLHWFATFSACPDNFKCPSFFLRPPYPRHKSRICNVKSLFNFERELERLLRDHPQLSAFQLRFNLPVLPSQLLLSLYPQRMGSFSPSQGLLFIWTLDFMFSS